MQLIIVRDEPLLSSEEEWATLVENIGESATTAKPQNNKKPINKTKFALK